MSAPGARVGRSGGRRPAVVLAVATTAVLVAVTLTAVLTGVVGGPTYRRGPVEFATGGTQGVYFTYGTQLAEVVSGGLAGVPATALPTAGSIENLRRVADGRSTFAFTAADAAADAVAGAGAFPTPQPIRALARVYDDYLHLVVPADSPVQGLPDLRGRRVSLGSAGSGTELIAARLLGLEGMVPADLRPVALGINDSVAALRAGDVDAFFWSGGAPTGGVAELARVLPVRLLPLDSYAERMRERFGPSYRAAAMPDGAYDGVTGLMTIAVPNMLVTADDTDPGLVYQVTRLLFASRERLAEAVPLAGVLDERVAIETSPVPLHPGALDHYRDRKL